MGKYSENTIYNIFIFQIQKERKSCTDYYLPLINTYVDLNNNQEWSLVNMEANLQQMFDKIKDQFWGNWLKKVKYTIKWDLAGVISDDSCFKIFDPHQQILIKTSAMVRPRIQLISIILHILIHIYLNTCTKGLLKINQHDENFRKIMLFFNDTINTEITVRFTLGFNESR